MANYFKWFGHSMVEVQIDDTTVLFDPFLKNSETKLERVVKSTFKVSDFNSVNYVFVSHEHFDHLDKESLVGIAKRNNATVYTTEACARELKALLPANLLRVVSVGQSLKVANLNVQVVQASHASESPVGFVVSGGVGGGAASVYFA
ncbi:MAG TPA: MBL fold metallo-hydrolase, partial [archaeon]|nr:MBL fold metallo-hydrolase [archaeon]